MARQGIVTLRDDGSLWVWETQSNPLLLPASASLQYGSPKRLGTHSDWIAIEGYGNGVVSLAADGGLWYWPLMENSQYLRGTEPLLAVSEKPQLLANIFK